MTEIRIIVVPLQSDNESKEMQRLLLLLTILLTVHAHLTASNDQETTRRVKYKYGPAYIYRVALADKQGSGYSLEHPSWFLSRRSLE